MTHSLPLRLSRKSHPAHGRPRYKGHDARLMGQAQRHYSKHTTTHCDDDNTNNNNKARTTGSSARSLGEEGRERQKERMGGERMERTETESGKMTEMERGEGRKENGKKKSNI